MKIQSRDFYYESTLGTHLALQCRQVIIYVQNEFNEAQPQSSILNMTVTLPGKVPEYLWSRDIIICRSAT